MRLHAGLALAGLLGALAACQDDRPVPTSPPASTAPTESPAAVAGADAGPDACPCWSARSLAATFPAADFYFEDAVPDLAAGDAQLQLVDVANASILQARVAFDPFAAAAGDNWCQVATFGTSGLARERVSVLKIDATEFAGCVALLRAQAAVTGASDGRRVAATD